MKDVARKVFNAQISDPSGDLFCKMTGFDSKPGKRLCFLKAL